MSKKYKIDHIHISEKVYQTLKEMILKNELKSGEKLNQEKLSRMLGVSRTPILSAFSKLEKEMLIEIIPRKGAYVKKLSKKEFVELYDIRLRLEPLGAYEATKNAVDKEIGQLKAILDSFISAVKQKASKLLSEKDYVFHMKIMEMSRNSLLYRIISSFNIIIISNIQGLLKEPEQSMEEHIALYNAIRDRKPELAERLMYEHILDSKNRINQKILNDNK